MLVANIAKDIFSLLTNATETWRSLANEPADKERADLFLRNFYYPLLVIVGVAVLIGSLWNNDGMALDLAMRKMSLTLMVLFGSFFLSSLILNKGAERWFGQTDNMARAEIFTGYSLSIYYALTLIMAIFPALFFLKFMILIIGYIIYEGSRTFYDLPESKRPLFTGMLSAVYIVTHWTLEKMLLILMPGLS